MKKKICICVVLGFIIFLIVTKIYQFNIIYKTVCAINTFINKDMYTCSVEMINYGNSSTKEIYYSKENCIVKFNDILEYMDFSTNDIYIINNSEKNYQKFELIESIKFFENLPIVIKKVLDGEWLSSFCVLFITNTEYEGKDAYKIITLDEEFIVDGDTYLLLCVEKKLYKDDNSTEKIITKYDYDIEFTEDDFKMPDLSSYTEVK